MGCNAQLAAGSGRDPGASWNVSAYVGRALIPGKVRVTLELLDDKHRPWTGPLELKNVHVSDGFGGAAALIFTPKNVGPSVGDRFRCSISLDEGKSIWSEYFLEFVEPLGG